MKYLVNTIDFYVRKHTIDFNMDYHESFCEHATYITIIQLHSAICVVLYNWVVLYKMW